MFRYRRYRSFLAFTVIAVFGFYYFYGFTDWETASALGAGSLRLSDLKTPAPVAYDSPEQEHVPEHEHVIDPEKPLKFPPPEPTKEVKEAAPKTESPAPKSTEAAHTLPSPPATATSSKLATSVVSSKTITTTSSKVAVAKPDRIPPAKIGHGDRPIVPVVADPTLPAIHWEKQPEHFPVTSTIQIPRGSPKAIPRIQHKFGKETEEEASDRKHKLKAIKAAAAHAWSGYKDSAWLHDEVTPLTGRFKDPFCGWAATMVDALDTLWIMGMKEEFEEAVKAVGELDFTTSTRKDIPLFETTIRYLGGLIAAYDVSNAKYKVLLDKAVELAEVLMGAFDTPNRMPVTYYRWMPTFASQPHRAGTRVVLAELGSLSVEFTRLAQLTMEPKYYDAIDRITDALQEWQNAVNGTLLPGMWPVHVDATGCEKPKQFHDGTTGPTSKKLRPEENHHYHNGPVTIDKVGEQDALEAERKLDTAKTAQLDKVTVGQKSKDLAATSDSSDEEPVSGSKADKVTMTGTKDSAVQQDAPLQAGTPGKDKIKAWGDPIEEGSLDSKADKAKLLDSGNKASVVDSPHAAASAGKSKIIGWDDPIEEGSIDSKDSKSDLLRKENGYSYEKRQLDGDLSQGRRPANKEPALSDISFEDLEKVKDQSEVSNKPAPSKQSEVCIPRGLVSSNGHGSDRFTLGGMSDSTYEYLPKQWLLLGGLEDKYRTMYQKSMDAVIDKLLFRPMTPDNLDILVSGDYLAYDHPDIHGDTGTLKAEGAHLTCFAGGMFAMGAKIFDREQDLAIGAKLTEGCIWAYNSTTTGIMPEQLLLMPCEDEHDCQWNKTKYWDALDPYRATRTSTQKAAGHMPAMLPPVAQNMALDETAQTDTAPHTPTPARPGLLKRQHDEHDATIPAPKPHAGAPVGSRVQDAAPPAPLSEDNSVALTPPPPPTHEEFVASRIAEERLPPGVLRLTSKKYILR
ncbi:hypothetical protein MBLNU459_g7816t1, partial [Dothideomycetes sp. NU459]